MNIHNFKEIGASLYQTYRTKHEKGYPVTKEFVAGLTSVEFNSLRDSFINERKKYEVANIFDHNETFWAMYDELQ